MNFSDEILMAFADGELDENTRHAIELAMRTDPALAARVRKIQALRSNVLSAFAPTLDEAVPQRLHAAARSAKVVHLNTVRAARLPPPRVPEKPHWPWREWGAIAGSVVFGVMAGAFGLHQIKGGTPMVASSGVNGMLTAQGALAEALSEQLSGVPAGEAKVRIGLSFVAKEGGYCRSFSLPNAGGLACRSGEQWIIPVMAATDSASQPYRQVGSTMPPAVLAAIEERIEGKSLDILAERAALRKNWRR